MSFQIMQQVHGKQFIPALSSRGKPLVYRTPMRAAAAAKLLTEARGVKHQPRPLLDVDWRTREQQRMADGHYKPVVWIGKEWWDNEHNPHHFAHVSAADPAQIGFTLDDRNGVADVQTHMKPGKYLTKFFGEVLTKERIREAAMQHSMEYEQTELKFATTAEEIQRVYKPRIGMSCFSGSTKANLYSSGDFAVAYIERDGEITARCVCSPVKQIYTRQYGDSERLMRLLDNAGFSYADWNSKKWLGLRLVKALHWPGFYTDFGHGVENHPDDPRYMIIA